MLGKAAQMISLVLLTLPGCGGSGGRPDPISGPFMQLFGPEQNKTFTLGNPSACLVKPGLRQFEYESASASGDSLHIVLEEFDGPGERDIEFGVLKPKHRIDVDLESGHKYRFFQHLRSDLNEIYNTYCHVAVAKDGDAISGHISCTLLWSDAGSPDFAGTEFLNNFVDLNAKFACSP